MPSQVVRDFLRKEFSEPYLGLRTPSFQTLLDDLAEAGISGGAVYDGLVAAAARQADATLLTLDARAAATYRAVGARFSAI